MCKPSPGKEGGGKIVRRKCSEETVGRRVRGREEWGERVVRSHATMSHKDD